MITKKEGLILAGLAIGGIGVASILAKETGDIPQQIKERAGRVLGSGEAAAAGVTYNIPDRAAIVLPKQEAPFDWGEWLKTGIDDAPTERVDTPAARRNGGGGDFAYAESIPMPSDVTPKKIPYEPSLLTIAPAGVVAKQAIQTAAVVEAQRISRAGVAGGGAITSFLKDVGSFVVSTPSRIGKAGAASGRAISSATRGVTGISKKKTTSKGTFASKSYQKSYKARATARHTAARKKRMATKKEKAST